MTDSNKLTTFFYHLGDNGERIEFQYDKHNRLYVNGEALVTQTRLSWFERILGMLVAVAVFGEFAIALLSYLQKCSFGSGQYSFTMLNKIF